MNTLQTQEHPDLLERSRDIILNYGYDFIVFKSKVKKAFSVFKRRFTPIIFNS